jgi:hypothetical protein
MTRWRLFPKKTKTKSLDVERDCALQVFTSDASCVLLTHDRSGTQLAEIREISDGAAADPATLVSNAMLRLAPELQSRIGDVAIFLDDPEISIVDSRQAKLTHFEGRALSEFGKYQLGGRPSAFASSPYGQTSQTESEKRIVGYLSEDKLSGVLFALGRLARYASFFGPWSLQQALASGHDAAATLTVHGRFSTLTLANETVGTVAVRHIPIGSATLIEAFGEAYGLSFQDAAQAMKAKPRLVLEEGSVAPVGSRLALLPTVEKFAAAFNDTADYFEYQRLSGRAPALTLSLPGHEIAGMREWLARMLQVDVKVSSPLDNCRLRGLNFLEGMRSGLLKLGNQLFDFTGGRFVPSKLSPGGGGAKRTFEIKGGKDLAAAFKSLSSQPVTAETLRPFAPFIAGALACAVLLYAGYTYLLVPNARTLAVTASAYQATLSQAAASPPPAATAEPTLWARDVLALTALMAYDMRLDKLSLTAAKPDESAVLQFTGTLPIGQGEGIGLVGRFLNRITANRTLARRFSDVTFQGVDGAQESGTLTFRLTAKVQGSSPP